MSEMHEQMGMILHADVDEAIRPYLTDGRLISEPVRPETVGTISDTESVTILTVKSQSKITDQVLQAFPNLKLLIARTVGTDYIDMDECKGHGVTVNNIPNYGPQAVAEHALALILACARGIVPANAEIHTGYYSYRNFLGTAIGGKTVGIVGTGRIGLILIKLLNAFGVTVVAYDIFKNEQAAKELGFTYVPMDTLLGTADILSLHIPFTDETDHLINADAFIKMKPGAILVNTSRGGIIDTAALIANAAKLKAIGLDVIEGEDTFTKDNPLLTIPNVILTPHCAFYTDVTVREIGESTMRMIREWKGGV